MQPLATCMHNLQLAKMAIGLQLSEPWLREYQVCWLCHPNSSSIKNSSFDADECLWRLYSKWDEDMFFLIISRLVVIDCKL
ncbi:hypothetical protein Tsubulata_047248 [Turnera subulata]|uniref:tRNA (adenine(58)-N(1))-methyltransferase non-catalytic subunit TRM6 n=1 Tax=Turnera subulata TaxID=218843 RepID=A0A9Q0G663_9ROSI|nr:hypothetical protein Tsubulata_047248 [Turnera subulata]